MELSKPQRSEVACILAQIQAEYESGKQGLTGFASGSANHVFITARMERIEHLHHHLQGLVGEPDAVVLLAQTLEQCSDGPNNPHHSQ